MIGLYDFKVVERLCKLFCTLVGCQLLGKSVLLRIDDTDNASVFGTTLRGTIRAVIPGILSRGPQGSTLSDDPCAIIQLDSSVTLKSRDVGWLIAVPRHNGYGLYRLYLTWIAVYISGLEGPNPPEELSWDDISAICSMKLVR